MKKAKSKSDKVFDAVFYALYAGLALATVGLGFIVGDILGSSIAYDATDLWIMRVGGIGCGIHLAWTKFFRDNRSAEQKAEDERRERLDRLYGRDES